MTNKKTKPPRTTTLLSDDILAKRRLMKGRSQTMAVTTVSVDRWRDKALKLEAESGGEVWSKRMRCADLVVQHTIALPGGTQVTDMQRKTELEEEEREP